MGKRVKRILENKPLCLCVNPKEITQKLLNGKRLKNRYRTVLYHSEQEKKTITWIVEKFNIKLLIIEVDKDKCYDKTMVEELIALRTKGVVIYEASEFYEIINERIPIVHLENDRYLVDEILSINIKKRYQYLKRVLDILFVLFLFPIAFPLILLGALLVFLTSKGNIFFSQIRVGEFGKVFVIRKLRTMVQNNHGGFTQANDTRITFVGRFLRLTKIDELPQLWNVLVGEMSVIGPRPEQPDYVSEYVKNNPFFSLRHMIKPGVTGWAQIHIPRATPEDNLKKLEYDLFYIKRYRWQMDVKILIETIRIVLTLKSN